jgi:hypothetical protein
VASCGFPLVAFVLSHHKEERVDSGPFIFVLQCNLIHTTETGICEFIFWLNLELIHLAVGTHFFSRTHSRILPYVLHSKVSFNEF